MAKDKVPNPGYDIEVDEYDADTIPVFCKKNRISGAFYYKLKLQGKTPDEMWLGNKRLISREARQRWRAEREAEAKAKNAAKIEAKAKNAAKADEAEAAKTDKNAAKVEAVSKIEAEA
jgi:hypothetical protein